MCVVNSLLLWISSRMLMLVRMKFDRLSVSLLSCVGLCFVVL